MLYAFELSGEHERIPALEVLCVLEAEGILAEEKFSFEQCLVVEIPDYVEFEQSSSLRVASRLAMSHRILKVVGISDVEEDGILSLSKDFDPAGFIQEGQTFAVRMKRLGKNAGPCSENIERKMGAGIYSMGFSVNLRDPDVTFRLLINEKAIFGTVIREIDRGDFESRNPQNKPFFHPGVLMPRVARALINISKIKPGELLLDPFCGTAGVLVEAGVIGVKVVGNEYQEKIVSGAKLNLSCFNVDYELVAGDACNLSFRDGSFDAIITDPPYGRSAAIKAESLSHLYRGSFVEMYRVLKKGTYLIMISERDVTDMGRKTGFAVRDVYRWRVHKSLTRLFTVFYKE